LPHEQFGFRKKHSTVSQLAWISDYISNGYNLHKHSSMVLLDLEKAYDTVWIHGLLHKLITLKIPTYLIFILRTFLEGCSFTVHLNGASSTPKTIPSGPPQGAVLSTTLFTIYISDMPCPPNTQLALYADDTAVLTQSWRTDTIARRLTHAMTMLHRYFIKWKLRVNINKTGAILFTKRRPATPIPLQFQHTAIPWSPHIRCLGIVLNSKLLFTKHLHSIIHKATSTFIKLFPLLARDSTLSIPKKLTLYKLLICLVLNYTALVWSNTSSSNYRQLQILQSKYLRVIGNYPRRTPIVHLHTALNLEPIHEFIYHLTDKFFFSCSAHSNLLVREIGNYTLPDLHRQYKKYIHKQTKHLLP
jgi:hypothetical protein